jgi:hypothetical protein
MMRRAAVLLALVFPPQMAAQTPGSAELNLGLQAAGQRDPVAAIEHLARATALLDAEREKEALRQAYLQLGLAYLTGLDRADRALPAFVRSGELGSAEAWLWAAMAAEKLGGAEEAAHFRAMALPKPMGEPAAPGGPENTEPAPTAGHEHAAPAAPAAPAPGAFEHLFGEDKPKPAAPAAPTTAAPPSGESKPAVDAFQYFFGKKKPAPKPEEKEQAPPPT